MDKDRLHTRLYGSEASFPVSRERGFTMIELLIAMAVASIVAMSGFALFSQSNWSYQVQENVGEAQQNARVAIDRIARDIRTAGFGLPEPPYSILGFDSPITVSDSSTEPDSITILGIGYEEGTLVGTNTKGQEFICYSSMNKSQDWPDGKILNGQTHRVVSGREYVSVDGIFYAELDMDEDSAACGSGVQLHLEPPSKLKGNFSSGTVYIIQAVEYSIVNTNDVIKGCSGVNPCLVSKDYTKLRGSAGGNVGRMLLAENIEDIQFAYGLDTDGNGVLDYTTYTTSSFSDSPASEGNIRAVRMTLSARTRKKDPKGLTFTRPAIENHPKSDTADNYRRRTLSKIVKLRN